MAEEIQTNNRKHPIEREHPIRKEKNHREIPGPIQKLYDHERWEKNIQLKPGHYPVKQKARPIPLQLQEVVGKK